MLLLWMERRIAKSADVRTLCPNARFGTNMRLMLLMFGECFGALASVDASCACRGRRMLRKSRLVMGSAMLGGFAFWLAAHPLLIPPRIALRRWFVLGEPDQIPILVMDPM
jgi:hypothetical protein